MHNISSTSISPSSMWIERTRDEPEKPSPIVHSFSISGNERHICSFHPLSHPRHQLIFRKNSSDQLNVSLDNFEEITNHSRFLNDRPTTIYLHGYANTQRTPAMKKIVEAYTKFDGHNLIVLDWAKSVDGSYLNSYANVQPVNIQWNCIWVKIGAK